MFSSSVRRAAFAAPSTPITPCLSHIAPRAAVGTQAVRSQSHQRRFSSSKPASPPADGPNGVAEAQVPLARPEAEKKARGGRKKAVKEDGAVAGNKAKQLDTAHHLPSVPSTQHISPTRKSTSDVKTTSAIELVVDD